jgi:hypothetical protein
MNVSAKKSKTNRIQAFTAVRRLRGILKRKPGERPLSQQMAEHKHREKRLDAARQTYRG